MELDVQERLPRTVQRNLGLGGPVGVVEGRPRCASGGDAAQVLDGERGVEAASGRGEARFWELQQRREVTRAGLL